MRHSLHLALILAASVLACSITSGQESAYVLRPDRVFDGHEMHDGWIVAVQRDRIIAAGPGDRVEIPSGSQTIDSR